VKSVIAGRKSRRVSVEKRGTYGIRRTQECSEVKRHHANGLPNANVSIFRLPRIAVFEG